MRTTCFTAQAMRAGVSGPAGVGTLSDTQFAALPAAQQSAIKDLVVEAQSRGLFIDGSNTTVNGNVVTINAAFGVEMAKLDDAAHAAGFDGISGVYKFPPGAQTAPDAATKKGAPWWLWGLGLVGMVGAVVVLKDGPGTKKNPAGRRLVDTIRPRDKVTILTPQGQERTGRAVMRGDYGWVLNMGGRHGTPGIASDENIVRVVHMKPKTRENPAGDRKMAVSNTEAERRIRWLDAFTEGYMDAALWSSHDESDESGGEPLDKNYDLNSIAPETWEKMVADCDRFKGEHEDELAQADMYNANGGHNFWLSRNGHGAGFFDRDLGDLGDALQEAAKKFGEYDLYVGDDGLVHGQRG